MKTFILKKIIAATVLLSVPLALQAADVPTGGASAGGPAAGTAPAGTGEGVPGAATSTGATNAKTAAAKSALARQDLQFIKKAAQGGMMEVQLGEVASQKAANAQVKEFGAMMVKDHGKANSELKELAAKKSVELPASLDSKAQSTLDRLSKLSGEEFDKAYVNEMVSDHKKDVADFEKAARTAEDTELRAWAAKTVPTLQMHLQKAQELKKSR